MLILARQTFGQTGFQMYGSFENGNPDSVNRQNLNTNLQVPIVSQKGRGMDFDFSLAYNSLIFKISGGKWTPVTAQSAMVWGWNLYAPAGYVSNLLTNSTCTYFLNGRNQTGNVTTYSNFVYTEPNGTVHPFNATYVVQPEQCGGTYGSATGYATDASGYYLSGIGIVKNPAGITIQTTLSTTKVTDTNGNFKSSTTTSNETDWTDSAGHLVLKIITNASNIQYEYQDTTGTYEVITLNLGSYNIKTNFACSGVIEYASSTAVQLPSSIVYPNGTQYDLTYEPTPANAGFVTGRLQKAILPDGGSVTYTFGSTNDGTSCTDGTTVNLTRAIYDGGNTETWQFARALSGSNWVTTVTAPQMPYDTAPNQSIFTFNSTGQETQQKLYQGSTLGVLLRTVNTTWASNATPATEITILEDNSTQSEIETAYDAYGNLDTLKEHDYGSGAPGAVLRTTTFTYNTLPAYQNLNILNRVTQKSIADSTGTTQYLEVTAYDGTTLSPCPTGVGQHNDTAYGCSFTTRGNPSALTRYTNASALTGAVTKSSYFDIFGNKVKADDDCCVTISRNYSTVTNYASPDSVVKGSGSAQNTISYTYNSYTGQVASITDPNAQTTSYSYDSMRRGITTTWPNSAQTVHSYNDSVHSSNVSTPIQGTAAKNETRSEDGLGRPTAVSIFDSSSVLYSTVDTEYDGLNRPYNVSNPFTSSAQYWTETTYDALGRALKTTRPDGSQTSDSYSLAAVTETDPAGHQRKMQSDGLGRLAVLYEPDPSNGNTLTLQTTNSYTVLDQVSKVTQGSQTRTFSYDGMGRLTGRTLPESGTTSFLYNSWDLVTQRTDARNVVTTYSYDLMNRLYQIVYNVGSSGVPATPTVTYAYGTNPAQYNVGRVLSLADGLGTTAYSYDVLGRPTNVQHIISGTTYNVGYQYNLAGSITALTYPSGRIINNTYDAIGRLNSVTGHGTNYITSVLYNAANQPTNFTMGSAVSLTAGYSADRLQLQSLNYSSGSTIWNTSYSYIQNGGNNGRITAVTDSVDSGRSTTYTYDALNRISTATTAGSTSYPQWGLSFTYDRYGNRMAQTVTAGTAISNSVVVSATTNHITTAGYAYDANGNLTNDGVNSLSYDGENRLVSSSGVGGSGSYSYRASGLRAVRVVSGVTLVDITDGNRRIAEYSNGVLANEYVYMGNQQIAFYLSGVPYYEISDHQSIRVLLNSAGGIAQQQGNYPFGESWYLSSLTNRHFVNYDRDSESSNDDAVGRFYVNRLARFSATASQLGGAVRPQNLDLYTYGGSDPVNRAEIIEGCVPEWDSDCCPHEGLGFCDPLYPPTGGGGGGGGSPCGADGVACPPSDPEPPPPPAAPQCFCQLKYRRLNVKHNPVGFTHSFWYVQPSNGQQEILTSGPTEEGGGGYLDSYREVGSEIYLGTDTVYASTWFNSGVSANNCLGVQIMESRFLIFPDNHYRYSAALGPNSNTFARWLTEGSGFDPSSPPGAWGWNAPELDWPRFHFRP